MRNRLLVILLLAAPLTLFAQPYLENGLVGFWPFNGNGNDYSGYDNHGTPVGVWPVMDHNGIPNMAYYFDGLASWVGVPKDKFVADHLTVSFFVMITKDTAFNFAMACSDFIIFTEHDSVGMIISVPAQKMVRGFADVNKWTHVVGTYDNNDIRFFINGALVDSAYHPGLIEDMNWPLTIGGFGSNYWEGELDEIRIYNRVLSEIEVGELNDYYAVEEYPGSKRLNMWPVPCRDELFFSVEGSGQVEACIFAMDGRCMIRQHVQPASDGALFSIGVSGLSPGVYFLEVRSGEARHHSTFTIVR